MIQAGCKAMCSEIHKLNNSIWNKELPSQWKKFITAPLYNRGKKGKK
jgi:hypothetical protein